jgi:hypothetical protein
MQTVPLTKELTREHLDLHAHGSQRDRLLDVCSIYLGCVQSAGAQWRFRY